MEVFDKQLFSQMKFSFKRGHCGQTITNKTTQKRLSQLIKDQDEVKTQIKDVIKAMGVVRAISLPIGLTMASFNADIIPVETCLKSRSRKLLQPPKPNVGHFKYDMTGCQIRKDLTEEEKNAIEFPCLYGDELDHLPIA